MRKAPAGILVPTLVLIAVSLAGGARSTQYSGPKPQGLFEYLVRRDQMFVGRVDSVRTFRTTPEGYCAGGLQPLPTTEISLTVSDVLYGAGIGRIERIRMLGTARARDIRAGDHVVASGRRSCADAWRIWGNVIPISASGALVPSMRVEDEYGQLANEPQLTIDELKRRSAGAKGHGSEQLRRVSSLHLVVITEAITPPGSNVSRIKVKPLSQLAGNPHHAPNAIEFEAPDDAGCSGVGVGDSLLVPGRSNGHSGKPTYSVCADYFKVDHGYVPSLGIALESAMDRFVRRGEGYELQAVRD